MNYYQQCFTIRKLFFLVFIFILALLLVNFYYFSYSASHDSSLNPTSDNSNNNNYDNNRYSESFLPYQLSAVDFDSKNLLYGVDDLNLRVSELLRIRSSVLKELRHLERNRTSIIQELNEKNDELEKLKVSIGKKSSELERLQLHIKQAVVAQKEAKDFVQSLIEPPLNLLPKIAQERIVVNKNFSNYGNENCRMYNCFDYSRCSLFSPFYVFIYNITQYGPEETDSLNQIIYNAFQSNIHITHDPRIACIYLLIVTENFPYLKNANLFQNYLDSLHYWGGDGRNNIILNINPFDLQSFGVNVKKAVLVQNGFSSQTYRPNYDILIPNLKILENISNTLSEFPFPFSPAKRKYFISFLGRINDSGNISEDLNLDNLNLFVKKTMLNLLSKHSVVNHKEFLFDFDCDEKTRRLCDNQTIILSDSTFNLIIVSNKNQTNSIAYDDNFCSRFFNALSTGSIPIIISNDIIVLPFEDVIDWRKAVIRLPIVRITELYILLKTYSDPDIIEMRRFGNHFYRSYFSNMKQFVSTFVTYFGSYRLQIPPPSMPSFKSVFYFNQPKYDLITGNNSDSFTNSIYRNSLPLASDGEEYLGPLEPPFPSLSFRRNYSANINQLYSMWNEVDHIPFYTFPSLPFDPVLPSDSKFHGSSYGFRPIGGGLGGNGKEFSEALGGNHIREQFTVVILSYEREKVLITILNHLKNLPYMNKVIIVWNSPRPLPVDMQLPDVGVDIIVIKSGRNSLNNRFLPFDEIKTEAILSIDDDSDLRHDEIIFAFRVWRESRERIVGFPARYHHWDPQLKTWFYNSEQTCEYSMILTGAAFLHKYYLYLYSYIMPAAIREKVDEFMNCEDIAMNFLVSHLTRKPPIKVTSKWTFRCPGDCHGTLTLDSFHFEKRHKCINYFATVYGYMPLLYTQFRADSVLFKTRVSHNKQKCFKYI